MTCEARQTPKGHTTVYLDGVLLATISGAGRTKEVRMRMARLIAASMNMCRYIPCGSDLSSLESHANLLCKRCENAVIRLIESHKESPSEG